MRFGPLYSAPVDNVPEGYFCRQLSDVAFLSTACGDRQVYGRVALRAPLTLLGGAVSGLTRTRGAQQPGFGDVQASRCNALVRRGVVLVVPTWWASRPCVWEHFGVAGCASSLL